VLRITFVSTLNSKCERVAKPPHGQVRLLPGLFPCMGSELYLRR